MAMPTCPLPGEVGVAPSLASCPGQLDRRVAWEREAELVACPPTPLLSDSLSAFLKARSRGKSWRPACH